jgi:replicative DNA helicase
MSQRLQHQEAERAILAAVLIDGGLLEGIATQLAPGDFSDQRNRKLYEAMISLKAGFQPVDVRTVQATLERHGEFESAGGVLYLTGLDLDLPDLSRVEAYVRLVREAASRRNLLQELKGAAQRLSDGNAPLTDVISEVNRSLRDADRSIAVDEMHLLANCFDDVMEKLETPSQSGLVGLPTGYPELDRMTLGWTPGQLVVIAGRPGMGKTALACCMAMTACGSGSPGAIFTLEMSKEELSGRLVCAKTGVPYWKIRTGHLSASERQEVVSAVTKLSATRLVLIENPYLTPARLAASVRRARREFHVSFAVIDYLGLMAADDHHENRNLELASISRSLKVLAQECAVPIIALHQLNRSPERRADPRPVLSDLRDSGAIEQDADTVLLIHRPSDPGLKEAEIIVAKQRNGMTGSVKVRQTLEAFRFDPWTT